MAPSYIAKLHSNRHRSRPFRYGLTCILLVLAGAWLPIEQQGYTQDPPTEYQVKAAYLFNFLKFVEWPDSSAAEPHEKWVIGIVGENPFGDELTQLVSGKLVQGHELQVRIFQSAENLKACQILFISTSERKRLPSILKTLNGASVLTVGDMANFTESGGMIQFVTEEGRVRFGIDVGATGRSRLKVSSKLLSLARTVTETDRVANN